MDDGLRARNIPRPVPPELDNAHDLVKAIEQAEQRKASAQIIFGQTPPPPKECPVCKQARWAWTGTKWICLNCDMPKRKGTGK